MTVYEDDASIDGQTGLLRRIHPNFLVPDKNRACTSVASGAFTDTEMSVALADTIASTGRTPHSVLNGYDDHALVSVPAQAARDLGQAVYRDPTHDEPAHGIVGGHKTRAQSRSLARACSWVVAPAGGCQPPAT